MTYSHLVSAPGQTLGNEYEKPLPSTFTLYFVHTTDTITNNNGDDNDDDGK